MWVITGSLHFWLRLLAVSSGVFLFSYGAWSLAILITASVKRWKTTIAKSISRDEADTLMATIVPWKNEKVKKATRSASKGLGLLLLGGILGWGLRDLRQFHHTYILNDVRILRRDAPDKYLMQTEWGQPFEMVFCSDYVPELPVHVILKSLVYEDHRNCKSIANQQLGYLLKRNELGALVKFTEGE